MRTASEVAGEWLADTFGPCSDWPVWCKGDVDALAAVLEADRREVRAAAHAEWKEQMLQLCEATGELVVNGFCLAMIVRMDALPTRSTEERAPGPYHCDCGAMLPHEPDEAARCKARSSHNLDELMRGGGRS